MVSLIAKVKYVQMMQCVMCCLFSFVHVQNEGFMILVYFFVTIALLHSAYLLLSCTLISILVNVNAQKCQYVVTSPYLTFAMNFDNDDATSIIAVTCAYHVDKVIGYVLSDEMFSALLLRQ